jgi:hypothetical protein
MNNFKDKLISKLKTQNYSIGLGNFAYTPVNEELTKWIGSDLKALDATFNELLDEHVESWFKERLENCIENGNFKAILFKSNPTQNEWEEHFLTFIISN